MRCKLGEKHTFENCIYSVKLKYDTSPIPTLAVEPTFNCTILTYNCRSYIRDIVLPGSPRQAVNTLLNINSCCFWNKDLVASESTRYILVKIFIFEFWTTKIYLFCYILYILCIYIYKIVDNKIKLYLISPTLSLFPHPVYVCVCVCASCLTSPKNLCIL